MTDLVSKEVVLALVEKRREVRADLYNKFKLDEDIGAHDELFCLADAIRALPAVDPRSDLEALRDEFATPAALNREGGVDDDL